VRKIVSFLNFSMITQRGWHLDRSIRNIIQFFDSVYGCLARKCQRLRRHT